MVSLFSFFHIDIGLKAWIVETKQIKVICMNVLASNIVFKWIWLNSILVETRMTKVEHKPPGMWD